MNTDALKVLLENIRDRRIDVEAGISRLKNFSYIDLGCAKLDTHRELRVGYPEVIFCPGKTNDQIKTIIQAMMEGDTNILATRASVEVFAAVKEVCPAAVYHPLARTITLTRKKVLLSKNYIAVVTAGTSDLPVAEEAAVTAEIFGNRVERIIDVGVAGVHRLFDQLDLIRGARGNRCGCRNGGGFTQWGGLVGYSSFIAAPNFCWLWRSFQGVTALWQCSMSCAAVKYWLRTFDNGFGAGCIAAMINKLK